MRLDGPVGVVPRASGTSLTGTPKPGLGAGANTTVSWFSVMLAGVALSRKFEVIRPLAPSNWPSPPAIAPHDAALAQVRVRAGREPPAAAGSATVLPRAEGDRRPSSSKPPLVRGRPASTRAAPRPRRPPTRSVPPDPSGRQPSSSSAQPGRARLLAATSPAARAAAWPRILQRVDNRRMAADHARTAGRIASATPRTSRRAGRARFRGDPYATTRWLRRHAPRVTVEHGADRP